MLAAAERAGWEPPETLTAVVVPEAHVRPLLGSLAAETLQAAEDLPGLEERVLLLVPDADGRPPGRRCCGCCATGARSPGRRVRGWRSARRSTGRCGRSPSAARSTPRQHLSSWS